MTERANVSYLPAIHGGYVNFLRDHPNPLFVLDRDLISEVPRLDRDVRAMDPRDVAHAIEGMNIAPSVQVLGQAAVDRFLGQYNHLILPNDDANHYFVDEHVDATRTRTEFVDTFFRWDLSQSSKMMPVEQSVHPMTDEEKILIDLLYTEAAQSPDWWRQVGAMVIDPTGDVTMTHNTHLPSPDYSLNTFGDPRANFNAGERIDVSKAIHAEARLIAQAARDGRSLKDAVMYVTTFPCPGCAKLIAEAGVSSVSYCEGYSLLDAQDTLAAANVSIRQIERP
jgi:dCMP deaminase